MRINEAVGIADLFEMSLDTLLDLKWRPQQNHVAYALRVLRTAARQCSHQVRASTATFREQLDQLHDIPVDIDADDDLRPLLGDAEVAAYEMKCLHRNLEELAQFCDQLLQRETQTTTAVQTKSREDKQRKCLADLLAGWRPETPAELTARLRRDGCKVFLASEMPPDLPRRSE